MAASDENLHPGSDTADQTASVATPDGEAKRQPYAFLKWPRRIFRAVSYIIAGLLLLVLLAIGFLHTPPGRQFIVDQLSAYAPASGLSVDVGSIDGSVLWSASFNDVKFYDKNQVLFLEVPEIDLNWRPYKFPFSGLDIRSVALHDGTLYAAPELGSGDPEAPTLPNFDIRVDRLLVDDLHVAEGLAGAERLVNLRAKANIRDGLVYLDAKGELGGGDRLSALIHAEPDGDIFDVDVDIRAPADGLLANLAGLETSTRIRAVGDGSWSVWDGAIVIDQGETRPVALRLFNQRGMYKLVGQVRPGAYLSGLPADALGEVANVALVGTLKQSVFDGGFALRGSAITLDAQGSVDLNDNIFNDVAIEGTLTNPGLLGRNVRLRGARIVATLDGPFRKDLSIQHQVNIAALEIDKTILEGVQQRGTLRYNGQQWTLPLDFTADRIVTGNDLLDPRLQDGRIRGTVLLNGQTLRSDNLAIRFKGLRADLSARGNLKGNGYALAGPVEARGLVLDGLGTLDGGAKIRFKIGQNTPWSLRANFNGRMARVANKTLTTLAGDNIRFRGGVALGAKRPIILNDVRVDGSKLKLQLDGRLQNGETTLAGSGEHTEYGPFTVTAEMGDDGPHAILTFASPLPAAGLKDVRVEIGREKQRDGQPSGFRIVTDGQSTLGPFDGRALLLTPPNAPARLDVDRLTVWKTDVRGSIAFAEGGVDGALDIRGGGLDGSVTLQPRDAGQGFDLKLRARNARFGGEADLAIARANIEAAGTLDKAGATITGNISARGLRYGSIFIGRLAARGNIDKGVGQFNASLTGRRGARFALQLEGDVTRQKIGVAARGTYAGDRITMPRQAVAQKQANGGWILQKTQISYGSGYAILEGGFGGENPAQAKVSLSKMPLSLIDVVAPDIGLTGSISGVVDVDSGADGVPSGNARLLVSGFSRSGLTLSSRPIDLAVVLKLTPDLLQTRAVIQDGGGIKGRLQGRIANLPANGGLIQRLQAGDLFAQLRYSGPADALWRLTSVEIFDITGQLSLTADTRGSLQNPQVTGSLAGDALRLRSAVTGTDLSNVKLRGSFSGPRLQLTSFSGTAPNNGTITGSGMVDLSGLGPRGPKIDVRLAAKNAEIVDRRNMGATVTGPLRIVSNGRGGTIAGRVRVNKARWTLGTSDAEADLPDIKTREINLPPDMGPVARQSAPWRYLIDASAGNSIKVTGMGLDSVWGGDVIIRGTTDDPRIGGAVEIAPRQGFFTFAGTQFELTRGRIDFDENVPINPRLDIEADTQVDNLQVTVKVDGYAEKSDITFSSTPSLPQEELLARMLFGGSITSLSATDALQLGAALAALQGGGGLDPINELRSAIGLDRLRIVPADQALDRATSVALGKNFGRKFYAEIITDGRGYNASEVEFRVTSWLSLLATVSSLGREGISAEVSKDY
ncbi:translocation/assembly module TamB domain-containing protein [Altericroceibacterium endophyticum]|uniref:Translocation and assembly module TamB C-terminal domain-containing protein n=1 Tax=Altericroceibacterium endophyticum TaxID=1808508 RepID=A0A6I4T9N4_9SPHN|nr:translocation/assembly module TamB domain-containing protein [Altericroceibacterium endophyticum]MXO66485.1 hypothetical protein [Altericroceibacterium endophyticum]